MRPGQRMYPARASSAIPLPYSDDPVTLSGRLWDQHVDVCPRCEPATPGCELGRRCRDVYLTAIAQEGRRDYLTGAVAITPPPTPKTECRCGR